MKKLLSLLFFTLLFVLQAHAVLKEQDLNRTLHVLRLELHDKYLRQEEMMKQMRDRNEAQHTNLVNIMKRCETTSLILYSQGQDFTFDVAYACQQATMLHQELRSRTMPYDEIKHNIRVELARYDSLIISLQRLPPALDTARTSDLRDLERAIRYVHSGDADDLDVPAIEGVPSDGVVMQSIESDDLAESHHHHPYMLDSIGRQDRDSCITYAVHLRDNVNTMYERIQRDNEHYIQVSNQVEKLNNYAQKKYADLQQSIFVNPGSSYFTILSRFPRMWNRMKRDFNTKYAPLVEREGEVERPYYSEWRGPIVLFASIFMLFYILMATVISNVLLRWCLPRRWRTDDFRKKRGIYIILLAVLLFAIAVMVVRQFITQNLMLMATGLMIEMAWLIVAIYISMAVRLKPEQCKAGARLYNPFILMSLLVICFRIVLIPNALVNLIFPPILLIFTIWQIFTLRRCYRSVPLMDSIYCSISLVAMLIACVMSWQGFTLMGVQVLVWWMFQLAAIASVSCCYELMESYERHVLCKRVKRSFHIADDDRVQMLIKRGDFVSKTWLYDFVNRALVPVCAVFSVLFSVSLAADIFNLRALCFRYFFHSINIPGVATFSLYRLCLVVSLYFVFRYINYLIRALWFAYQNRHAQDDAYDITLSKNVIGLITWGIYIITVFLMLHVPSTGIQIVTGGLATGMGFASKSLLENFFYGISLMSGRVRVGDYIECDGIIGRVESITYQSTQLHTLDGSIVAILNSDLFSKNFKNLTRNHQYELTKIPFGVAYGTNVDQVRQLILDGVRPLCVNTADGRAIISPDKPLSVTFSDFGASSVDLFLVAWVLVDQRIAFTGRAKEKIYEVLNANGIEIPFPQQDIYIRSVVPADTK